MAVDVAAGQPAGEYPETAQQQKTVFAGMTAVAAASRESPVGRDGTSQDHPWGCHCLWMAQRSLDVFVGEAVARAGLPAVVAWKEQRVADGLVAEG